MNEPLSKSAPLTHRRKGLSRTRAPLTRERLTEKENLESPAWKAILLFGPCGVGKGTVGKNLALMANQVHLSMGEIFRKISKDSPLGKRCFSYLEQGNLIPDHCTIQVWESYVRGLIQTYRFDPWHHYLLLDGIPRTVDQAEFLRPLTTVVRILLLEVSNEGLLLERLQRRAREENRIDDLNPSILRRRLELYQKTTEKVLACYPPSIIVKIDGSQSKLQVLHQSMGALLDLFSPK